MSAARLLTMCVVLLRCLCLHQDVWAVLEHNEVWAVWFCISPRSWLLGIWTPFCLLLCVVSACYSVFTTDKVMIISKKVLLLLSFRFVRLTNYARFSFRTWMWMLRRYARSLYSNCVRTTFIFTLIRPEPVGCLCPRSFSCLARWQISTSRTWRHLRLVLPPLLNGLSCHLNVVGCTCPTLLCAIPCSYSFTSASVPFSWSPCVSHSSP